jgi:hypothetical protein
MNGQQLQDAIGQLPEELLASTAQLRGKKRSFPVAWVSLAACLCLVVGLGFFGGAMTMADKAENAAPEMESQAEMASPEDKFSGLLDGTAGSTVRVFRAKVLEVHNGYLLVEPLEGEWERSSADRIEVTLEKVKDIPALQPGDLVEIGYGGTLLEMYPARAVGVATVKIVE